MLEKLEGNKFSFLLLIISGILIIPSIIIGPKAAGIVFLLFIIVVVWNMVSAYGKDSFIDVGNHAIKTAEEEWNNKKYFTSGIFFLVVPLCAVGAITVGMMIFGLLFLF